MIYEQKSYKIEELEKELNTLRSRLSFYKNNQGSKKNILGNLGEKTLRNVYSEYNLKGMRLNGLKERK